MRFLIHALSVTNASGRHVLLGHLKGLAERTVGRHEYVVLWHPGNRDIVRDLGPNVAWVQCPAGCAHWVGRAAWERMFLARVCRARGIDGAFTPAGHAMPLSGIPQIVFCQNPWALVGGLSRGLAGHLKAALQRRSYRHAVRRADVMVFNSRFMEAAYRSNAGQAPRNVFIAHQGVDEETFAAAACSSVARVPGLIVSVSAMAPHKDVGTLLRAFAILRDRFCFSARLKLVGAWPDRRYETAMRALMEELGVARSVELCGHVSREDLHAAYASASVFALFSLRETYLALGVPGASVAEGVRKMKDAAIAIANDRNGITPGDCSALMSEIGTYFDRAAAAVG